MATGVPALADTPNAGGPTAEGPAEPGHRLPGDAGIACDTDRLYEGTAMNHSRMILAPYIRADHTPYRQTPRFILSHLRTDTTSPVRLFQGTAEAAAHAVDAARFDRARPNPPACRAAKEPSAVPAAAADWTLPRPCAGSSLHVRPGARTRDCAGPDPFTPSRARTPGSQTPPEADRFTIRLLCVSTMKSELPFAAIV